MIPPMPPRFAARPSGRPAPAPPHLRRGKWGEGASGKTIALDSTPGNALKKKGRRCVNILCPGDGLHSAKWFSFRLRPVGMALPTGQAYLIKHSPDQISQQAANSVGQHCPEQVHHVATLLSERSPRLNASTFTKSWQALCARRMKLCCPCPKSKVAQQHPASPTAPPHTIPQTFPTAKSPASPATQEKRGIVYAFKLAGRP
jgi:hypothetical protein